MTARDVVLPHFPDLTEAQLDQLDAIAQTVWDWNQRINVISRKDPEVMLRHVLPNVMGPVLVIATIGLAVAVLTEATLSFLGVGVPPTEPSLGTLIRIGNNFLFAGEWWIVIFPGIALAALVLAVNLLGDWLRDVLNPKLR